MVLVLALTLTGLYFWDGERAARHASMALTQRRLGQAAFWLQRLEVRHPWHPQQRALRAHFYTLLAAPSSIVLWQEVIRRQPEKEEYRVAAVLACLQFGRTETAERLIREWPQATSGTARDRAALAWSFARGDWVQAETHARRLVEAEPDRPLHHLQLAKIQLHTDHAEVGRQILNKFLNDPVLREEALRALIQDDLKRADLQAVVARARAQLVRPDSSAGVCVLALEALAAAGQMPGEEELCRAWQAALSEPVVLNRLVRWVSAQQNIEVLRKLVVEHPSPALWQYPTGQALVEAFAPFPELAGMARSELIQQYWDGIDDLRQLCLSRLQSDEETKRRYLERAIGLAGRRYGGERHLLHTVMEWDWRPGLQIVLEAVCRRKDATLDEFAGLLELYQQQKNTAGLLEVSLRLLERNPDNPVFLNNAAYFSVLRSQNLNQALLWAREAVRRIPESCAFQATLLMALCVNGHMAEAGELAVKLPVTHETASALARFYTLQGVQPLDAVRTMLRAYPAHFPEEEAWLEAMP